VLAAGHLGDHPVDVHAHQRIRVDQILKLGDHGMQRDVLAFGLHPPPVAGQPRFQFLLAIRQPAGPAPHINTIGSSGHACFASGRLMNRQRLNTLGPVDDPLSCLVKLLAGKMPDPR
jgi:hypothetical protein